MKKIAKLKTSGTIHDTLTGYDFRVDDKLTPLTVLFGLIGWANVVTRNEL